MNCPTCDGRGLLDVERDERGLQIGAQEEFCQTCNGTGVTPITLAALRACDCGHWTGCNAKVSESEVVSVLSTETMLSELSKRLRAIYAVPVGDVVDPEPL